MVVQRSSLVEPASVPRVSEGELLEVEVMAELVTDGAQEGAERRDILTNRCSQPHANQHGVWRDLRVADPGTYLDGITS